MFCVFTVVSTFLEGSPRYTLYLAEIMTSGDGCGHGRGCDPNCGGGHGRHPDRGQVPFVPGHILVTFEI